MMAEQDRCVKAALLLSRILLAVTEDVPFGIIANDVEVEPGGRYFRYEDTVLKASDIAAGALMLLRGLTSDLAGLQGVEPLEVARLIELYTATTDVYAEILAEAAKESLDNAEEIA